MANRIDLHDVGVPQPRNGPCLPLEPLQQLIGNQQIRPHHLDGDASAESDVLGLEYLGEATPTYESADAEVRAYGALQPYSRAGLVRVPIRVRRCGCR